MKRFYHILALTGILYSQPVFSDVSVNSNLGKPDPDYRPYTLIEVYNPRDIDAVKETVEIDMCNIPRINQSFYYILDAAHREIPSQITYDNKIIFKCDLKAKNKTVFKLMGDSVPHEYKVTVNGKVYPERADDLAWENELGGYRIYGPATRRKGEKAFGNDIFFKHPKSELILPILYNNATSKENHRKLDSLKKVDPVAAKKFSREISFHYDHGLGMDCYAVGPTLGAGAVALLKNDSLIHSWCYEKVRILDAGPLRFSCKIEYYPIKLDGNNLIREECILSLDSESHLNHCSIKYPDLINNAKIVTGFPIRDSSEVYKDSTFTIIAYSHPTQRKDSGRVMLGMVLGTKPDKIIMKNGHVLAELPLGPNDEMEYLWGFAWDREYDGDFEQWKKYLNEYRNKLALPLEIQIRK